MNGSKQSEINDSIRRHLLWRVLKIVCTPIIKNRKILSAWLIYSLSYAGLHLVQAYAIYVLLQLLTIERINIRQLIYFSLANGLILFILQSLTIQIEKRASVYFTANRMNFMSEIFHGVMNMEIPRYENEKTMQDVSSAIQGVSTNHTGIEGVYRSLFRLIPRFFLICAFLYITTLVSGQNPIYCFIFIAILAYTEWNYARYRFIRRDLLNSVNQRTNIFGQEAADYRFGKEIRIFNYQQTFLRYLKKNVKTYSEFLKKISNKQLAFDIFPKLILCGLLALSLSSVYLSYASGQLSLAGIVFFVSSFLMMIENMILFQKDLQALLEQLYHSVDAIDFIDSVSVGSESNSDRALNLSATLNHPLSVEFRNVSFSYANSAKKVLENCSFILPANQITAIVGLNGAGKTTLAKLLIGFYQPDSGAILLNGVDARTIPLSVRYSLFSCVFQDTQLLSISLKENITCQEDECDNEKLNQVLSTTGLSDKITALEKGADTVLGKDLDESGLVLSGGESQKVLVGRALYHDESKILIMDEPTASFDALAEHAFYQEIAQIFSRKTGLFISHRLASTRFCDLILLLEDGKIVESGTHAELLERKGKYADLFEIQSRYYAENSDQEG